MDKFLTTRTELLKYKNDEEIVKKTARQVQKDFAQFGFEIDLPENFHLAYNTLFDQLSPFVESLINENFSRLYSVLYCIDLNERTIKEGIAEMNNLKVHDAITHLILERELKKVLTREYFSRNQ